LQKAGTVALEKVFASPREQRVEEQHPEVAIVRQEKAERIGLVPRVSALQHPVPGIFEAMEDVVEMNHDALLEPRDDIEEFKAHIALCLEDMA